MSSGSYCLHCCQEHGRPGGCDVCGPDAAGLAVDAHPMFLPPGTTLQQRYLVGRVLGHGGFGITYLAVDVDLGLRVAIKEYFPRDCVTRHPDGRSVSVYPGEASHAFEVGLGKFLEEGRSLARFFDHPNIVSVVGFFKENGTGYLVMRYMDGVTLLQLLGAHGGRLPEREAVLLMTAALDGLRAVHEAGILHRDIKPANVFVTREGQVKLLDFGAARSAVGERSRSITQIWTPGFAPPEQCHDGGRQGPWTDVYGAGATMYQALTGRVPPDAIGRALQAMTMPSPREVVGEAVSEPVSAAVMRAMALDPEARYRSARAFLEAMASPVRRDAGEVAGKGVRNGGTRHDDGGKKTGRSNRRHPGWIVAAVIGSAAVAALVLLAGRKAPERSALPQVQPALAAAAPTAAPAAAPAPAPAPAPVPAPAPKPSATMAPDPVPAPAPSPVRAPAPSPRPVKAPGLDGMLADARRELGAGNLARAKGLAEGVLKVDAGNAEAKRLLADAAAKAAPPPPAPARDRHDEVKQLTIEGRAAYNNGDYAKAIGLYNRVLGIDKDNALVRKLLDQARQKAASPAPVASPPAPAPPVPVDRQAEIAALLKAGRAAYNMQDYDKAISLYNKALAIDRSCALAQKLLDQAKAKAGQ